MSSALAKSPDMSKVHTVELVISNLLRIGVITSLLVVCFGTIVSFVHHPEYLSSSPALQKLTKPGAAFPNTLRGVVQGVKDFRGQSIVLAGLLLLIATPVVRVAVSVLAFVYQSDRIFTLITLLVLFLLLLSFVLGKAEG
jgi:uncharacterized membrane protein